MPSRHLSLRVALLGVALVPVIVASCAAGSELGTLTTSSSSSSSSTSTSSSSTSSSSASSSGSGGGSSSSASAGTGGTGGAGGAGGGGGTGGMSVDGGNDAGDDAGDDGGNDAGSPTGTVVLLAGGGSAILAGEFHPATGWATSTLTDATKDGPAIVLTAPGAAIGVIRSTSNAGELRFTGWTPGSWSPFAAIAVNETTRATPALVASGTVADLVFHGDNFKHYYAAHVAAWAPVAEPVGGASAQSFGPSPASIAAIGSDAIVAFAGNNGDLYDQTRTGGAWQGASAHNLGNVVTLTPAIIAPAAGPDLMIVFVRSTDTRLLYTTRSGGIWSSPVQVDANALTNDPPALAALPGGGALLAYRGQDGKVYWSRRPLGGPWTTPAALATPNVATPSTPAIAAGVGGADAEMVFVDGATSTARHSRLTGTTWSAPAAIGGTGLTRAAISSL